MKEFNKYINLKKKFKANFKGHELNNLLSVIFISHSYGHLKIPKMTIKKTIKSFFYIETYSNLSTIFSHNGVVLSHAKWKRNDYRRLVNLMGDSMKGSFVFDYQYNKSKKIRLDIIFFSILQVFYYLRNYFSFKQLLFLIVKVVEIKYKLLDVDKYAKNAKIKGFIAFNSSIYDDAILCSVLNKYNIETFSLQHGYYSIYKKTPPLDIINYENLMANKLLCWGQSTYNNMLTYGLEKNRLVVLGNPRINFSKINKFIYPKFKRCLVLFGRDIYHKSNIVLLNIISKINCDTGEEFILKLHPTLKVKGLVKSYVSKFKILDDSITVEEAIESFECDVAFSNNTSAFFDALITGIVCLRFTKFENEDFGESFFKFNDINDYYIKKQDITRMNQFTIENMIINNLKYNFSENFNQNILELNNRLIYG